MNVEKMRRGHLRAVASAPRRTPELPGIVLTEAQREALRKLAAMFTTTEKETR